MSKLAEYRALERALADKTQALDKFRDDPDLHRDIEFEQKLRTLVAEYGKSWADISKMRLTGPAFATTTRTAIPRQKPKSKMPPLKVYRNPLNNQIVETRGEPNEHLEAWRDQFGVDFIEKNWLVEIRD